LLVFVTVPAQRGGQAIEWVEMGDERFIDKCANVREAPVADRALGLRI
jgi:hypothetical protein